MEYKEYAQDMADKVISMIDNNRTAWRRTFANLNPQNYVTGKPYRNSNHLALSIEASIRGFEDPRWLTKNQAEELGGHVTGKPAVVAFWSDTQNVQVVNPETGEKEKQTVKLDRPVFRTFAVWNIQQCEGIENPKPLLANSREGDLQTEEAIARIKELTNLEFGVGEPAYIPSRDSITMPAIEAFRSAADYYETMLHEVTHWTGAKHRESRNLANPFGTVPYAREEMVAEIGALVTAGRTGIELDEQNSAAYMASWWKTAKQLLQDKPHELVAICRDAYTASDFILEGKELERLKTLEAIHLVELTPEEKASGRIDLSIPFSEKNEAKALAAGLGVDLAWDKTAKTWFAEVEDGQNIGALAKYRTDKMNAPENHLAIVFYANGLAEISDLQTKETRIYDDMEMLARDVHAFQKNGTRPMGFINDADLQPRIDQSAYTDQVLGLHHAALNEIGKTWAHVALFNSFYEQGTEQEKTAVTRMNFTIPFVLKDAAKEFAKAEGIDLKWNRNSKSWDAEIEEGKDISRFQQWLAAQTEKQPPAEREAAPAIKNAERVEADMRQRVYLKIPFSEKDQVKAEAKRQGVPLKFDPELKAWHTYKDALTPYFDNLVPPPIVAGEPSADAPNSFGNALAAMGAKNPAQLPIFDGRFHRLQDVNDAAGQSSISYKAFNNGIPNALILNHRTGHKLQWIDKPTKLTNQDYTDLKLANANRVEENRIETAKRYAAAAETAKADLNAAKPAPANHPYLVSKGVQPHDIKIDGLGNLLIPLTNVHGEIRSLQWIDQEGTKGYAKGGEKGGHFHVLGKIAGASTVIIAEGFATAATLHEVTGLPVVAAIDSGNLLPVGENLKRYLPEAAFIFAADNDKAKKENYGVIAAEKAAAAINAELCIPEFAPGEKGSDYNDLGQISKGRVYDSVKGALATVKAAEMRRDVEAQKGREPTKPVAKSKSTER